MKRFMPCCSVSALCCCLVSPNNDPKIIKTQKVIQAYFAAVKQGDIESMPELTSAEHRNKFIAANMVEDFFSGRPWRLQKSRF